MTERLLVIVLMYFVYIFLHSQPYFMFNRFEVVQVIFLYTEVEHMLCISEFVSTITFPLHIVNRYQESKSGFAYALGKHRRHVVCNTDNLCQVLSSMFWGPFLPKNISMYINHIYT